VLAHDGAVGDPVVIAVCGDWQQPGVEHHVVSSPRWQPDHLGHPRRGFESTSHARW